ncbi:MAG: tRNA1(Val) (adenine(37)-N6)-methyltransferase [Flavobacteriales bacterium]
MSRFDFRDFSIDQTDSPLKVSTDAILLGASIAIPQDVTRVLDVGTGTGVIAMILASRFEQLYITALEPNHKAYSQAVINFENASFSERLEICPDPIATFRPEALFDVVVSNPPYFIDDLKSADPDQLQAKHLDESAFYDFIEACTMVLKPTGLFWLILPKSIAENVLAFMLQKGFGLIHKTRFHSNQNKPDIRWVLAFEKNEGESAIAADGCFEKELTLRNLDGSFHQDYIALAGYLHAKKL